jgi:hypothetical protein
MLRTHDARIPLATNNRQQFVGVDGVGRLTHARTLPRTSGEPLPHLRPSEGLAPHTALPVSAARCHCPRPE